MNRQIKERGAVSIFVVIFAALLVTIVTISFVRIMIQNQQEATVADISQSAYDSALAGVEDAKRVLANDTDIGDGMACNTVKRALDSDTAAGDMSETKIQQQIGSNGFEQAYTCVKIDKNPRSIVVDLSKESSSTVFPLKTVNNARFKTIELSWKLPSSNDGATEGAMTLPDDSIDLNLYSGGEQWGERTPALLRTQLIQYNNSIVLNDLNSTENASSQNTRTKFLYPAAVSSTPSRYTFTNDQDRPTSVTCNESTQTCRTYLKYTADSDPYMRNVYLRLNALYSDAQVTIRVYAEDATNPSQALRFEDVQAIVDSTGRAGNAFRRVVARVNLQANADFPYPNAAVELDGNLCKTFSVTNRASDYRSGECDPSAE